MTLLAFEDVSTSKLADLVENSQKIKVASEVNHELLKSQSKDTRKIVHNVNSVRLKTCYFDENVTLESE
jgi:hypothetical protein